MTTFTITSEKFSGPLEKLLELTEAKKLEITEISLAAVTDEFLKYLDALKEQRVDLRLLADFISVASKLVFIKSKLLLPQIALSDEEEADIKDLEHRIALYRELQPLMKLVRRRWQGREALFGRQFLLLAAGNVPVDAKFFYPGANVDIKELARALGGVLRHLEAFALETETIKEKIISLEERIKDVLKRLEEGISSFKTLSAKKARGEIAAIFLAVLHLARDEHIRLEQTGHFSDILISKVAVSK